MAKRVGALTYPNQKTKINSRKLKRTDVLLDQEPAHSLLPKKNQGVIRNQ